MYVEFTYSGFQGDLFGHNFLAIMHDGEAAATLEYGSDAAHRNASQRYGSRLDSATHGFTKVNPPPGMSEAAFEKRIIDAAKLYDAIPEAR